MCLVEREITAGGEFAERRLNPQSFVLVVRFVLGQVANQGAHQFIEPQGGQSALRSNQTGRQTLNHPDRDLGPLDAHRLEDLAVEFEQVRLADSDRTRRPGFAQNDTHFPEEFPGTEFRDDSRASRPGACDLDPARLDDVEVDPFVAFVEDDLSVLKAALKGALDLYLSRFGVGQRNIPQRSPLERRRWQGFSSARSAILRAAKSPLSPASSPRKRRKLPRNLIEEIIQLRSTEHALMGLVDVAVWIHDDEGREGPGAIVERQLLI